MPDDVEPELFRIVQVEVPGGIDLSDGRWTIRGHANRPRAVVVVESTERPRRRLRRRRADADDEVPLEATVITVIDADPLDARDVERWLQRADGEAALTEAMDVLRRLLHLAAVATAEPEPRPVRLRDLAKANVAYGTGAEGAYGRWTAAKRIPVPADQTERQRRGESSTTDERLAELLGGRDPVLAAEVLTLRARQDLTAGRVREAALGLRMALEAAIAELEPWRAAPQLDEALAGLRASRSAVADAAAAAVRGGLDDPQEQAVRAVLRDLALALARRAGGRRVGERGVPSSSALPGPPPPQT